MTITHARGLDDAWISADSDPGLLDVDWTERVLLHPGWFEQHVYLTASASVQL